MIAMTFCSRFTMKTDIINLTCYTTVIVGDAACPQRTVVEMFGVEFGQGFTQEAFAVCKVTVCTHQRDCLCGLKQLALKCQLAEMIPGVCDCSLTQ